MDRSKVAARRWFDLPAARIADAVLRRIEPGHVRLCRSSELGSFLQRAGLSRVMLRKLSGGGFAIVRGSRPELALRGRRAIPSGAGLGGLRSNVKGRQLPMSE